MAGNGKAWPLSLWLIARRLISFASQGDNDIVPSNLDLRLWALASLEDQENP